MIHYLKTTLVLLFLASAIISCKNEEEENDVTRPTIEVTWPALNAKINSGTTLVVKAVIRDNKDLSQYKIEIHDNFDGHSHMKKSPPFSYIEVTNIDGLEFVLEKGIIIPDDVAAGAYHFTLKAIDMAGNEAELTEVDFEIINMLDNIAPVLVVRSAPMADTSDLIVISSGQNLNLQIDGFDNLGLQQYKIQVINELTSKLEFEKSVEVSGVMGQWTETIPLATFAKGDYHLEIVLIDEKNNKGQKEFQLEIQ